MRTTPLPFGAQAPRPRRIIRGLAALAAVGALLLVATAPAAAKEFLQARLEAPISFQSPPGAELEVAVLVTVPDGVQTHPVDGSPVWLRLIGPTGDTTEAPGKMGTELGRYVMRIEVPEGGPRRLELFLQGAGDLPILLDGDPFTFKPMGPETAQLAPALAVATPRLPAATPASNAQAAAPTAVANAQAPVQPPADAAVAPPASSEVQPWVAPLVVILVLAALTLGAVVIAGRARGRRGSLQGS
jgi:hypothetical protein